MAVEVRRKKFTVDEYEQMGRAGILREDDRVELVDGEIVEMTPIGSQHAGCVKGTANLFARRAGDRAVVSVQDPIRLGAYSEPQPDVAILKPRPDFYRQSHPGPQDVLLAIEVSDASTVYDRETKIPLYARAGIPEAWRVDLQADLVEVYRDPSPDAYHQVQTVRRGERLAPSLLPDIELTAEEILGNLSSRE
jgi:Uma2 family endonuclease